MGRFFNFGSKLILEILPSVAATVIGGYLLTQLHFGHATEPVAPPPQAAVAPAPAATPEAPTLREDRAAMREVLKERRENPEPPAVVRPVVTAAPASAPASEPSNPSASVAAELPAAIDSGSPSEPVEHAAAPSRANFAAPAVLPRARPESVVYAPAPPPGLPQAIATGVDTPLQATPAATVAA